MLKKIIDHLVVLLIRVVSKIPAKFIYRATKALARVLSLSNFQLTRTTRLNLKIAFPDHDDAQHHKMVEDSIHHSLYSVFEIAKVWHQPFEYLENQFLTIRGREVLQKLIDSDRPIILVCPHLGCWEMVGYWLNTIGYRMSILYNPLEYMRLDNLMIRSRSKGGNEVVPVNSQGIRRIYRDLKENKIVGILPDQAPREVASRVMAPFFSADAATMVLIHTLIKKTEAVPILITAIRDEYKGFHIYIDSANEISNAEVQCSAQAMNKSIEKMIGIAPEQYQWTYRRYRYNPLINYNKGTIASPPKSNKTMNG